MAARSQGTTTQRGQKRAPSKRGDFTGNMKEALQKEHEDAVEESRERMGLISAGKAAIKDEGVIDMMGSQPVLDFSDDMLTAALRERGIDPELVAKLQGQQVDLTGEPVVVAPPAPAVGKNINASTGSFTVEELPEEQPVAAAGQREVLTPELLNHPTMVRALYDLDDITVGYGNNFSMKEGYRYKLARWVAAHLEEKQLCVVLDLDPA